MTLYMYNNELYTKEALYNNLINNPTPSDMNCIDDHIYNDISFCELWEMFTDEAKDKLLKWNADEIFENEVEEYEVNEE